MKLNLVGNQNDRNYVMESETRGTINLVELLERFGKIMDYMTESMVASFYQVPQSTIENYGSRNTQELNNYGYRVYKKSEILNTQLEGLESIPNRGLRLYPIEAVLFIGLNYLTDSKIADKIKSELPKISPDLFLKLSKGKSIKRQEIEFINQLEKALKSFNIQGEKQFKVLSYRIDYYIPSLNIAIEYDENDHSN